MITFRIDDVGASTKYYNQHGKKVFKYKKIPYFYFLLANFWFFKRIEPFREWGKYEELTATEWQGFLKIFKEHKIKPIVAITACWVDKNSQLIPFPKKFSDEAKVLKKAFIKNNIVVANHGLTHCVVGKHLPSFLGSNRKFHREFWPELDEKTHEDHILRSQKILESFFNKKVEIFVPPGNVWSVKTYRALLKTNIKNVISANYMLDSQEKMKSISFENDQNGHFFSFHDRDLKLFGEKWLRKKINEAQKGN
ncbi:hypothetical protein COT77_00110 [Candidatus Berkelbacteria bacterium CG10_big_fil_rev_8_21_14_0_10_41_12]|uniref:NodB homology domain-containing protein n=1 Tax=Candidatus Berkelbacteria bacterium CG10_big_fil_rev_8_21_14_0_10_41_12 TaxID=1974513 RepID=A0A2M6WY39_9BACT|nr:MAG: hypothetical protein COT77_00110 [Candidatus Berkelbacteria bacterium CG10_big_fil_rev_8_21_14_0_10_41_12]